MADTWGLLPKSAIDDETIEEAVARIVAEHNGDPEAHLAAGQSLQSHKASEIIDHLAKSIIADKLAKFSVALENFFGDRFFIMSAFESLDGWFIDKSVDTRLDQVIGGLYFQTKNVTDSYVQLISQMVEAFSFYSLDEPMTFQTTIMLFEANNLFAWIAMGDPIAEEIRFGFKIENSKLYSVSRSGGVNEETEIMTLTDESMLILRAEHRTEPNKVLFYANGVLKATHETRVASGNDFNGINYYLKTTVNGTRRISVHDLLWTGKLSFPP